MARSAHSLSPLSLHRNPNPLASLWRFRGRRRLRRDSPAISGQLRRRDAADLNRLTTALQVHRLDLDLVPSFVCPHRVRPHGEGLLTGASGVVTPPWVLPWGARARRRQARRGLALPWVARAAVPPWRALVLLLQVCAPPTLLLLDLLLLLLFCV